MQAFQASACAIVIGLITGCGGGASCWVEGQVTFGGKPVQEGEIVLRPLGGTPGSGAPAKITGGKYEIAEAAGLQAGKYLVLITAANRGIQYIPDKYNIASSLEVELDVGANNQDFSLDRGEVTRAPVMRGEQGLVPPSQ
ncbi:MAG: hypothetical protein GX575_16360 [Candidatus Anammoximicrobium sp.]|nr:hypothetical protein [Candidatus Anammoximicrobium sp.]